MPVHQQSGHQTAKYMAVFLTFARVYKHRQSLVASHVLAATCTVPHICFIANCCTVYDKEREQAKRRNVVQKR
jgi:hypothetical protein